jgi:hypothetical protein
MGMGIGQLADFVLQSFSSLPDAGKMPFDEYPPRPLQDAMPVLDSIPSGPRAHMLRILEDLIVLEPSRRRSADEIIRAIRGATYHDVDAAALLRPFIIQVARRYAASSVFPS